MATVGVRDLKAHTSQVPRRVRENRETIDVTLRGEVVARLVPVPSSVDQAALAAWWDEVDELAEEISAVWPAGVSAALAVAEGRRDL